MSDQAAQDPIRLGLGQTADARTCGSCHFFERMRGENPKAFGSSEFSPAYFELRGYCNIRLPAWVQKKLWDGDSMPPEVMRDTDTCDLHKPSGKAYVVSKVVQP